MRDTGITLLFVLTLLLCACSKQNEKVTASQAELEQGENVQTVYSDDSLVTAYWWDTGEGGTAPDIEARCRFKTASGKMVEEARPLLRIVHPDEDYSHREVERVVSLETDYGDRIYFFYLRAKTDSRVFEHDLVAFHIVGDSLLPFNAFQVGGKSVAHIQLDYGETPAVNNSRQPSQR